MRDYEETTEDRLVRELAHSQPIHYQGFRRKFYVDQSLPNQLAYHNLCTYGLIAIDENLMIALSDNGRQVLFDSGFTTYEESYERKKEHVREGIVEKVQEKPHSKSWSKSIRDYVVKHKTLLWKIISFIWFLSEIFL